MNVARRVYLYAIALVALGVLVSGLAGLLEVGLETAVERIVPPTAVTGVLDENGSVRAAKLLIVTLTRAWSSATSTVSIRMRRSTPPGW